MACVGWLLTLGNWENLRILQDWTDICTSGILRWVDGKEDDVVRKSDRSCVSEPWSQVSVVVEPQPIK